MAHQCTHQTGLSVGLTHTASHHCPTAHTVQAKLLSFDSEYRGQTSLQGGILVGHVSHRKVARKEGNVLFNDILNSFLFMVIWLGHMVKDHSDSERGNLLPPLHGLLFLISSKGSFICTILQTG